MAVIVQQTMPTGVPVAMIDDVTVEMDVDTNPPDGMIVHTHYEEGGRIHIVDVWESEQAHQTFVETRLRPAMGKVAAQRGFDLAQAGEPETSVIEAHRVVRGR
jgi:hypothetical protein